eukprot:m.191469 g.191469  ORF g.191469 m.191469 type:complete len:106 (+) comp15646_c0_seq24:1825-2142(+)
MQTLRRGFIAMLSWNPSMIHCCAKTLQSLDFRNRFLPSQSCQQSSNHSTAKHQHQHFPRCEFTLWGQRISFLENKGIRANLPSSECFYCGSRHIECNLSTSSKMP